MHVLQRVWAALQVREVEDIAPADREPTRVWLADALQSRCSRPVGREVPRSVTACKEVQVGPHTRHAMLLRRALLNSQIPPSPARILPILHESRVVEVTSMHTSAVVLHPVGCTGRLMWA